MTYEAVLEKLPKIEAAFLPCFAFSVHKCGSSLLEKMIADVCAKADIPSVSIPQIFFQEGFLDTDWINNSDLTPLFQKRLLYFGFRSLPASLTQPEVNLKDRRFVILVRDPRDALVSQYFSFGKKSGSHAVPKNNPEAFLARRESQSDDVSIDQYVINASRNLRAKLEAYRDNLNFDVGLIRKYEDVFFDKKTFLHQTFTHFGISVAPDVIRDVAEANDIRPKTEDETRHIRKGFPGDHKEKLQPETIAKLNDAFREVGGFYGYDL